MSASRQVRPCVMGEGEEEGNIEAAFVGYIYIGGGMNGEVVFFG